MAPKKHRLAKKSSAGVTQPPVDPDAWVDTIDLDFTDGLAPTIDHDALSRAYKLSRGQCSQEHAPGDVCNASCRCFGGVRQVKGTAAALNTFVEKIVGPQPLPLEPLPAGKSTMNDDNEEVKETSYTEALTAEQQTRRLLLPPTHRGLRNLGNTCYLNAVLQLMFHVPELRRAIIGAAAHDPTGPIAASGLPSIFLQLGFARYPVVDATPLVEALQLDKHIQQDAQELLGLLIEWLGSSSAPSSGASGGGSTISSEVNGMMLYTRTCPDCGADAKKVETFSFLSVQPASQLSQSLNRMCDDEPVEGFICGKCHHTVTAMSRAQLKRLPRTLLIHLSRFGFDVSTGQRTKIDTNISFPTTLDMTQWVGAATGCSKSPKYLLEGVVNHLGTTPQRGHYTFHCRQRDDVWYSFDDADVSKLRKYTGDTTASRDAYVLVYRCAENNEENGDGNNRSAIFPSLEEFPTTLVEDLLAQHAAQEADHASWQERFDACMSAVKNWSALVDRVVLPPKASEQEMDDGPMYFVPTQWLKAFGSMFSNGIHVGSSSETTAATVASKGISYAAALTNAVGHSDNEELSQDGVAADTGGGRHAAAAEVATFEVPDTLRCPHKKLWIGAPVKAIREGVYCELASMYGNPRHALPALTTDTGLCTACAIDSIRNIQEKRDDAVLRTKMLQLAQVRDVTVGHLVNASVIDLWVESNGGPASLIARLRRGNHNATPFDNEEVSDEVQDQDKDKDNSAVSTSSDDADLSLDLLCPHGKLAPDVRQYVIHSDLYRYLIAEKGFVCLHPMTAHSTAEDGGDRGSLAAPQICDACVDAVRDVTSNRHANNLRKLKESKIFTTFLTEREDFNRAVWRRNVVDYAKKHKAAWEKEQQRKNDEKQAAEAEAKKQLGNIKLVVVGSGGGAAASAAGAPAKRGRGGAHGRGGAGPKKDVVDVDEMEHVKEGDANAPIVIPPDTNTTITTTSAQLNEEDSGTVCPPRVVVYKCVPMMWVESWLAWYKDASNTLPPPGPIVTSSCLCPHGRIPVSVRELHPKDCAEVHGAGAVPALLILNEEEYQSVTDAYGDVQGPTILFKEVDVDRVLDPPACTTCVTERVNAIKARTLQYTNGILSIEGSVKRSKKKSDVVSETLGNNHCQDTLTVFAQRVSMRILERHQLLVPAESMKFAKSKTALKNEEWYPLDKSFAELGVEQFSTMYFVVDEIATKVEGHFDPVSNVPDTAAGSASRPSGAAEVSFETTRLSNLSGPANSNAAGPKLKECKVCTFLNPPKAIACEICESFL
jgi:hypothetical protein